MALQGSGAFSRAPLTHKRLPRGSYLLQLFDSSSVALSAHPVLPPATHSLPLLPRSKHRPTPLVSALLSTLARPLNHLSGLLARSVLRSADFRSPASTNLSTHSNTSTRCGRMLKRLLRWRRRSVRSEALGGVRGHLRGEAAPVHQHLGLGASEPWLLCVRALLPEAAAKVPHSQKSSSGGGRRGKPACALPSSMLPELEGSLVAT